MDYSRKISERQWNQPDKGELESKRELTFIDDIVQKSHIERELLMNLDGISTVFDGGAGSGRFSILLAKRGRSFDLVMSFDAPISYTYPNHESVIAELVRLARRKVMFSVSSRLGCLPYFSNPIQKIQFILDDDTDDPFARLYLDNREEALGNFRFYKQVCFDGLANGVFGGRQEIDAYERGETPWVITYGFMPEELLAVLRKNSVTNIRLAGPGESRPKNDKRTAAEAAAGCLCLCTIPRRLYHMSIIT
jgi:hypothetical protein